MGCPKCTLDSNEGEQIVHRSTSSHGCFFLRLSTSIARVSIMLMPFSSSAAKFDTIELTQKTSGLSNGQVK